MQEQFAGILTIVTLVAVLIALALICRLDRHAPPRAGGGDAPAPDPSLGFRDPGR